MADVRDYSTVLSVKPDYCTIYRRNEQYRKGDRKMSETQLANIRGKKYTGKVTIKGISSMRSAVGWLISLAKSKRAFNEKYNSWFDFRVCFITLTLSSPQMHDDKAIKRNMLNQFIVVAKRRWSMSNYVWRAEPQKNGNIHFHILTDVYLPHKELREVWNNIQYSNGYVNEAMLSKNPNSTDIHSLKTIGNVAAYVSKYCTKEDETRRKIEGKIYGVSDGLNRVKACQIVLDETKASELRKVVKKRKVELVKKDYAIVLYLPVRELINEVSFAFREVRDYVNAVYYQKEVDFDELMSEGYDVVERKKDVSVCVIEQLNLSL